MAKLGYEEPLFALSPAVQVTLATIEEPEIHAFIQNTDLSSLADKMRMVNTPLLLEVLDLSHWLAIMNASLEKKEDGLSKPSQAHAVLGSLLEQDESELKEAEQNTKKVEAMLLAINPQDRIATEHQPAIVTCLDNSNLINDPHPLLSKLNLGDCRGAVGDLKESINISQFDQQRADMEATCKGPSVPFLPTRIVE